MICTPSYWSCPVAQYLHCGYWTTKCTTHFVCYNMVLEATQYWWGYMVHNSWTHSSKLLAYYIQFENNFVIEEIQKTIWNSALQGSSICSFPTYTSQSITFPLLIFKCRTFITLWVCSLLLNSFDMDNHSYYSITPDSPVIHPTWSFSEGSLYWKAWQN